VRATFGNTAALNQLLLESYVSNLPDVWNLSLPCPSLISETTVTIVKFRCNRESM